MDAAYQVLEKTAETLRPFVSAPTSIKLPNPSPSPFLIEDGSEKQAEVGVGALMIGDILGGATMSAVNSRSATVT